MQYVHVVGFSNLGISVGVTDNIENNEVNVRNIKTFTSSKYIDNDEISIVTTRSNIIPLNNNDFFDNELISRYKGVLA